MSKQDKLIMALRVEPFEVGSDDLAQTMNEAADEIECLRSELNTCRNELCLRCGQYKTKHLGSCEGCRWST